MNIIREMWQQDKSAFQDKSLFQILRIAGDGKLRDDSSTSKEFREFLAQVPSVLLQKYTNDCLTDKFEDSGLALQDIINQIGSRLEFDVENGLYKGRKGAIGFDGIWKTKDGFSIIVEVKTTDAYRINLDHIVEYRQKLIKNDRIDKINSSILIVVGREDTGDLEAQIRGSRHAWDVRVISTESLLKLLSIKETLDDPQVIHQINELLKPREYTRLDKLIELIFLTSQDIQLCDVVENELDKVEEKDATKSEEYNLSKRKDKPVNFYDDSILKIEEKLKVNLIKRSRIAFTDKDKKIGVICAISKTHEQEHKNRYWFAFHPHQGEFLETVKSAYVAYGCGSSDNIVLIPYKKFEPLLENFGTTQLKGRKYWHIIICEEENRLLLKQPKKGTTVDVTEYKLS